jgi:hypothetical protein
MELLAVYINRRALCHIQKNAGMADVKLAQRSAEIDGKTESVINKTPPIGGVFY